MGPRSWAIGVSSTSGWAGAAGAGRRRQSGGKGKKGGGKGFGGREGRYVGRGAQGGYNPVFLRE
eukprot:15457143-Alexandrium_andersonii.AAC.1